MDTQSWAKGESWPRGRGQETVKFKQKNVFLISPVGGITHPVPALSVQTACGPGATKSLLLL